MKNPFVSIALRRFSTRSLFAGAAALLLALAAPTPAVSIDQPSAERSAKGSTVAGKATNTITSLVFNDDGTMSIESEVQGHLSHIGHFTGRFSYLAIPSPVSILLLGTAELITDEGTLSFAAVVTELGVGYPYTVAGTLTVTSGTGRFEGAKGLIGVSGRDTEDPTDTLSFKGALLLAD